MIRSATNPQLMRKDGSFVSGAATVLFLLFGTGVLYGADSAALVSQTIADNTQQTAGANYSQSWTLQNNGTTTWGSGYSLQYVSGNGGCNHTTIPLGVSIAPNTTAYWTVSCTAPSSPGTYREDWKLVGPSGTIAVGAANTVWVQIVVAAASGDAATFGSETIQDDTRETAGATFSQVWTINNTGTSTWGSTYSLQYVSGNAGCNHATVPLSVTIAPKTGVNYTVLCTAPAAVGTYREDWKLVGPSGPIPVGGYATIWVQIVVQAGAGDAAALTSETIADNTQEAAGAAYTQTWVINNTGSNSWGSTYSLQYVSGNAGCNHATSQLNVTIAPNTGVNWSLNCIAPATAGTYREDWKLVGPSGTIPVGGSNTVWIQIVVPGGVTGDAAALGSQTIADNTKEAAGAAYTQVWTINNTGSISWGSTYSLQYVSGNAGCNHATSQLSITVAPKTGVNWSLNCIAPATAGTYREDWKLVGPAGAIPIGASSTVWVQIVVPAAGER